MSLRDKLIATAIEEIETNAGGVISLREFSRKAGVSEAAPYRHFKNRAELLGAVAAEGFKMLHTSLLALDAIERPTKQALFEVFECFARSHGALYDLMHRLDPGKSAPITEHLTEALATFRLLAHLVSKSRPGLDETAIELLAYACWSEFHGRVVIEQAGLIPPHVRDKMAALTF